jgi:hypothetical protein
MTWSLSYIYISSAPRYGTYKRVGSSVHGFVTVDALNLHQSMAGEDCDKDPDTGYSNLDEQPTDNNDEKIANGMINRSRLNPPAAEDEDPALNEIPFPVPSQKKKKKK